jgi:hypothetical protein
MNHLRAKVVAWAAARDDAAPAAEAVRELAPAVGLRVIVLVEGASDRAAVERLAR